MTLNDKQLPLSADPANTSASSGTGASNAKTPVGGATLNSSSTARGQSHATLKCVNLAGSWDVRIRCKMFLLSFSNFNEPLEFPLVTCFLLPVVWSRLSLRDCVHLCAYKSNLFYVNRLRSLHALKTKYVLRYFWSNETSRFINLFSYFEYRRHWDKS